MFQKGSRYKDLTAANTTDAKKRNRFSKSLRLIPKVPATFEHTVTQSDRIDLLAYKYYGDAHKWWHICDANPTFPFPTDCLDKAPIIEEIFELVPPAGENKWAILINNVKQLKGVGDSRLKENVSFKRNEIGDVKKTVLFTLTVTYNRLEIDGESIINTIKSQGFTITNQVKKGRLGERILIPPDRIV